MDSITISVDSAALLSMFDRLAALADYVCREVGRDTAKRIVAEAWRRVERASGQTESGIHWEMSRDGKGYVVLAYQAGKQEPVDKYLEYGSMFMRAKPFFVASAMLESNGHMRRLEDAIQKFLNDVGR